jgi:hypothetical protein
MYDFGRKAYPDSELRPKAYAVKSKEPTYGIARVGGGGGKYTGYDKEDEDALYAKLAARSKWTFNPELANDRSATMWLLDQGKNPDDYVIKEEDIDEDPETPNDLVVRTKDG